MVKYYKGGEAHYTHECHIRNALDCHLGTGEWKFWNGKPINAEYIRKNFSGNPYAFVDFMLAEADISIIGGHPHQASGINWMINDYIKAMEAFFQKTYVFPKQPCSVFLQVSGSFKVISFI